MGEKKAQAQKVRRAAAAAYDYENDGRWAEYWSNILIPPHLASRADVVDHFKPKFYQRCIDPDLAVEAIPSTGTSQSSRSSASSSASPTPSSDPPQQRKTGSTNRTSRTSTASGSNPTSVRWDQQTIQFSVNAWVFVVRVLGIIPLVPQNLSNRAYRLSFMGTACSSLYSLYTLYGVSLSKES